MNDNGPKETVIERKVCEFAKAHRFLVYKFTSPQRRSVPDRIMISPHGMVIFIEFKRKGQHPTREQAREIRKLREQQQTVFIVDNVDEGKRIVGLYAVGVDARGYCESSV